MTPDEMSVAIADLQARVESLEATRREFGEAAEEYLSETRYGRKLLRQRDTDAVARQ